MQKHTLCLIFYHHYNVNLMYFSELLRNLDLYSIVILVQASRKLFQQLQNIGRYTNVILVQTSRKHQILGTIIVCI